MRLFYLFLIFLFCISIDAKAIQQDSLIKDSTTNYRKNTYVLIDSASKASKAVVRDSIINFYLKPNPLRANLFIDSLLKEVVITDKFMLTPAKSVKIKKNNYGFGNIVKKAPKWFLFTALALLILFGLTKILFRKEIDLIFRGFFDNRVLSQINKEDNVFVSWQFLFLYLTFAFTIGLFTNLMLYKISASAAASEFSIFLLISLFAFIFFGLKILLIRFLGFMFNLQKLVRDYTNIIYLAYFNLLFVLLPITFYLCLINISNQYYIFWTVLILFSSLIVVQYLRITFNIILNYRLSKFYLILYLCALEICPILILAKTINTSL